MFHKVKAVSALPDFRLSVQFAEGVTKIYNVEPLFSKWRSFKELEDSNNNIIDNNRLYIL